MHRPHRATFGIAWSLADVVGANEQLDSRAGQRKLKQRVEIVHLPTSAILAGVLTRHTVVAGWRQGCQNRNGSHRCGTRRAAFAATPTAPALR